MKDITAIENAKDVIRGTRINRETLYYTVLFGAATITAIVLLILGISYRNTGLIIYTGILAPLFLASSIVTLRLTMMSVNTLYVEEKTLCVKTFFKTKKIPVASIDKLTAATDNKGIVTQVKLICGENTFKYKYRNFNKEDIAHLKRATSKY